MTSFRSPHAFIKEFDLVGRTGPSTEAQELTYWNVFSHNKNTPIHQLIVASVQAVTFAKDWAASLAGQVSFVPSLRRHRFRDVPPVKFSRGTRPGHAANSQPLWNSTKENDGLRWSCWTAFSNLAQFLLRRCHPRKSAK
jgi:hypothetical protein